MIVGQKISNRYKIIKLIGGGGMSNVYLAQDMILDRQVAIKILRYDINSEEELYRRFHREALSATSLMHPNIVSVYDVGEDGDMHYIVMEYIEGKTLKKYIQENSPLSPARTVHIMKQLTSAIAHAHDNGIIHRDIKPQNLLVDLDGNVKITDFGIATTLSATSYTQTNSVIGTVHYLSPEQARGGIATNQSDIYALGIVMYELLTGELPFSGESAVAIALKHLQSETPSVRSFDATIPQSVENIVLKATEKNILHRYASAQQMQADLETVLSPERIHEPKYVPPVDNDATRIIPIIKNNVPVQEPVKKPSVKQETKVMPNVKEVTKREEKVAPQPEKVDKPKKPTKAKKKKWPIIVGTIVLLAILAIVVYALLMPKKIEVPDVALSSVDDATKQLEDLGFVVGDVIERTSEEVEKDYVIATDPEKGTQRVKGSEINLIVSIGEETIEMENFVGKKYDQVMSVVQNYEFKDVTTEEIYSDEPAGTILDQTPAAGEEIVIENTEVEFVISKGLRKIKVANLSGYNDAALKQYAESSGFNIQRKKEVNSDTVPAGSVVSQYPEAGTEQIEGSTIEVTISKGAAEKPVKFRVISVEIPYTAPAPSEEETTDESEEEDENEETEPNNAQPVEQVVRVYIQDKNNTMADLADTFMITKTTTYRLQLVIEEGSKAAYRISVDNNIIVDEKVPYDD